MTDNKPTQSKQPLVKFGIVATYGDDVALVFFSSNRKRVKAIRNELREKYGEVADFQTISTHMPPPKWLAMEEKIKARLARSAAPVEVVKVKRPRLVGNAA